MTTTKTCATYGTNNAKTYVLVVTLSIIDNIKLWENTKQGFKRTILWKKYSSEIILIDWLSFKNGYDDSTRNSFDKYCMQFKEIKDFNGLVENKPFLDQQVKNKKEANEKLIKMPKSDDYTTGNLLEYLYHLKTHCYRFIKTYKYRYSSTN